MGYRVVVTGHTPEGDSTCLRDSVVAETPGWMFNFWATEASPADNGPASNDAAPGLRLAPPPSGSLFRIFHIPPDRELARMTRAELEGIARRIRAPLAAQPGERLWHRTDTVDYVMLVAGAVTLHLDIGDIELNAFDVIVQRGTNHAWSNKGETTAVAVCVMVGADPLGIVSPTPEAHRRVIGG